MRTGWQGLLIYILLKYRPMDYTVYIWPELFMDFI